MSAEPWQFECNGKPNPGDTPGSRALHFWERNEDRTATCSKCGVVLTVQEANNCFRGYPTHD